MLFVDSNIFMYSAGKDHPYKIPSLHFLEQVALGQKEMAVSVEILQEILYRFYAINQKEKGVELFDQARALSTMIFPVTNEILDRTRKLLNQHPQLAPRDAIHVGTMQENRISTLISFDKDFDVVSEIKRIEPKST